ncbi:MAG: phosphonopyruvate decarboxylase [Symploca sp. SIO2C1]|nr:phosphonopyruvate decarboxylase [Symploca sp. SIO2C1]
MIEAQEFVEAASKKGFGWYTGVPCSFLTPFINYVIDDNQLTYISSANEGDALATAAGAVIGGKRAVVMMQNSGLGNAINPLTSLAHIFRIPLLIICTLRGDPNLQDEPQHQLMGQITGKLLETMKVPWEFFPTETAELEPVLQRVEDYFKRENRPYALIMRKGTVAPYTLSNKEQGEVRGERKNSWGKESVDTETRDAPDAENENATQNFAHPEVSNNISTVDAQHNFFQSHGKERISRNGALSRIVELTEPENTVVIATTGYTGRELFALSDRNNHLYMVGSMGCASSLGLGLALARRDLQVVVLDGDGAALMRMGNFATIGAYGGSNLTHILLDNEVHDSTGAQATVSAGVSFAKIAQACGYAPTLEGDDCSLLDALLAADSNQKPKFGHLKIRSGKPKNLPRPSLSPEKVLQRLMIHIGSRMANG